MMADPISGNYRLLEKIADGGMGEVYKAVRSGAHGFEKTVVLKKLLPFFCDNKELINMLIGEAKVTSALNHPNIVQTIDFQKMMGTYCLVMEYVNGIDLARLIKSSKEKNIAVGEKNALFIILEALKGLQYAHDSSRQTQKGPIIHRDISPSNILISYDGSVKISDFGIARSPYSEEITKGGQIKGKINYMSPEQIRCEELSESSDIFSLYAVLYEMLYLSRPFECESEYETTQKICQPGQGPDFPNCDVSRETVAMLKKGLEKDKKRRYACAGECIRDIRNIIPKRILSEGPGKLKRLLEALIPHQERAHAPIERTPLLYRQSSRYGAHRGTVGSASLKQKEHGKRFDLPALNIGAGFLIIIASLVFYFGGQFFGKKNVMIKDNLIGSRYFRNSAGTISADSSPASTLYLNGKRVGPTPIKKLALSPGNYRISLIFETGNNFEREIEVRSRKHHVIFEKLPEK